MATKTWTCTIKNGSTDALQAPNGLDILTAGNPTGPPPQWGLAPGAQTTLQCSLDSAQRATLNGTMTWIGAAGSVQLNWIVPYNGAPSYAPTFTGYSVVSSDASPTGVTYTIAGGAASSASGTPVPPPGIPVRVAPSSGSTAVAKPDAPQLWILGDLNGQAFPHFNCGVFGDLTQDKLVGEEEYSKAVDHPHDAKNQPRKAPGGGVMEKGKNTHYRTLQTSGCGLFALSTILGGYDCIVPQLDATTKQFKSASVKGTVDMRTSVNEASNNDVAGKQVGSPRAFLQFIWHYVMTHNNLGISTEDQAKEDLRPKILAPDGPGALYFESPLSQALAFMFSYHPAAYDAQGNPLGSAPALGMNFTPPTQGQWLEGTEIKAVTDSIVTQHQPMIVGVGSTGPVHQVLVVGLVKYGRKTYYITIDSGFSGDQHPGGLLTMTLPLSLNGIMRYTASTQGCLARPNKPNIYWYRPYTGTDVFNSMFDFALVCKQVREW